MHSSPDMVGFRTPELPLSHTSSATDCDPRAISPNSRAEIVQASVNLLGAIDGLAKVGDGGIAAIAQRVIQPDADRLRRALRRAGVLPKAAAR